MHARTAGLVVMASVMLASLLGGCRGIPDGTMRTATVGAVTLNAKGAGIVKAEAGKTTYKIKCALCGYEADNVTVDTPVVGKPYGTTWVCPKCGHKQKIVLKVAAPQGR